MLKELTTKGDSLSQHHINEIVAVLTSALSRGTNSDAVEDLRTEISIILDNITLDVMSIHLAMEDQLDILRADSIPDTSDKQRAINELKYQRGPIADNPVPSGFRQPYESTVNVSGSMPVCLGEM